MGIAFDLRLVANSVAISRLKSRCPTRFHRTVLASACLLAVTPRVLADRHVTVTASADPAYMRHKFSGTEPVAESYVFAQGQHYEGVRRDYSIEQMNFRQIAEYLAPGLARASFFPTKDLKAADLLLVVHWGTTKPRVSTEVRTGFPTAGGSPAPMKDPAQMLSSILDGETDLLGAAASIPDSVSERETRFDEAVQMTDPTDRNLAAWSNAQLLGYTKDLRRFSLTIAPSTEEYTLRANLEEERYFVIVKAYDLREFAESGRRRRPVWTLFANVRSPGNNFATALGLMGASASSYFGRETNGVQTVEPKPQTGTVLLGPLIILGEAK